MDIGRYIHVVGEANVITICHMANPMAICHVANQDLTNNACIE
jgi:hypothetical protein